MKPFINIKIVEDMIDKLKKIKSNKLLKTVTWAQKVSKVFYISRLYLFLLKVQLDVCDRKNKLIVKKY